MRFDSLTMLADAEAITGTSKELTKKIDLGKAGLANPPVPYITVLVQKAFSHGATFSVVGSATDETYTVVTSAERAVGDLKEGAIINMALPQDCPRYLKLKVTSASSLTTGTITAGLQLAPQTQVDKAVFESAR